MNIKLSVCIPAYNRPEFLGPLLDSILRQNYREFEIVICEDHSPKRAEIRKIVESYRATSSIPILYFENDRNLGYDGNFRRLIEESSGDYCLFMGNDDLLASGALATVADGLKRHPNVGVLLRTYASFEGRAENLVQTFRYFESEAFFPAGEETVVTFFRRCVVISGLTLHRQQALKHSTSDFDGTLLYQLHLVVNILLEMNGLFLPEVIALYRNGGVPDFGNSESEKGKFVPNAQTPESSLNFMRGMLKIAGSKAAGYRAGIYQSIFRDIGNYSYPILSIQANQRLSVFVKYGIDLMKMGFWRNRMFNLYFLGLVLIGRKRLDYLIGLIKRELGYTPKIGKVYRGESL